LFTLVGVAFLPLLLLFADVNTTYRRRQKPRRMRASGSLPRDAFDGQRGSRTPKLH
jgi:hypothetical protein